MRFHANNLTMTDVATAAARAGVTFTISTHGSRSRRAAYEIALQGDSNRSNASNTGKAATWDQWGVFIDMLFEADDSLTIPRAYENRFQFDFRTSYRFEDGEVPTDMHGDHKFEFIAPFMFQCTKCSAVTNNSPI